MSKNKNIHIAQKDELKLTDKQIKKIRDIVHKLKMECNLAKAPMFVTFVKENTDKGTVYENDMVFATTGTSLKDNRIGKILLKLNGYETKYPKEIQDAIRILENYINARNEEYMDEADCIELDPEDNMIMPINDIVEHDVDVYFPRQGEV